MATLAAVATAALPSATGSGASGPVLQSALASVLAPPPSQPAPAPAPSPPQPAPAPHQQPVCGWAFFETEMRGSESMKLLRARSRVLVRRQQESRSAEQKCLVAREYLLSVASACKTAGEVVARAESEALAAKQQSQGASQQLASATAQLEDADRNGRSFLSRLLFESTEQAKQRAADRLAAEQKIEQLRQASDRASEHECAMRNRVAQALDAHSRKVQERRTAEARLKQANTRAQESCRELEAAQHAVCQVARGCYITAAQWPQHRDLRLHIDHCRARNCVLVSATVRASFQKDHARMMQACAAPTDI